jgi:hypothetical protein
MSSKSDSEKILEALLWFGLLAISIPASMFRAFVLTKLWLWFIVPQFQIIPLPFIIAMGIDLMWDFFWGRKPKDKPTLGGAFERMMFHEVTLPAWALLCGWIIQSFR